MKDGYMEKIFNSIASECDEYIINARYLKAGDNILQIKDKHYVTYIENSEYTFASLYFRFPHADVKDFNINFQFGDMGRGMYIPFCLTNFKVKSKSYKEQVVINNLGRILVDNINCIK